MRRPRRSPAQSPASPRRSLRWGPDDGTHKARVRVADGTEYVTGGLQVGRGGV